MTEGLGWERLTVTKGAIEERLGLVMIWGRMRRRIEVRILNMLNLSCKVIVLDHAGIVRKSYSSSEGN